MFINGVFTPGKDKNIIKDNTIKEVGIGIRLNDSNDNQVLSNTIISSESWGISVSGTAIGKRNVIQGNTIDQSGAVGIYVWKEIPFGQRLVHEDLIIKDNSITNSNIGIQIQFSLNTVVIGNTLAGNTNNIDDQGTDTVLAGNINGTEVM